MGKNLEGTLYKAAGHKIRYLWREAAGRCPPFSWHRAAWRETCRIRARHWSQASPAPTESSQSESGTDKHLLLLHRETANHSYALIINFSSAAQKAVNQRAVLIIIFSCDKQKAANQSARTTWPGTAMKCVKLTTLLPIGRKFSPCNFKRIPR